MHQWYVVYTKPGQEKLASQSLARKGLSSFLPMICEPWRKNPNRIEPLFPNYLFVRMGFPEEYYLAVWTPGIKRFVSFGEEPTPIDDALVEFLIEKAGNSGIIEARRPLRVGDEVTISSGPLGGLAGIIESPPDQKGRVRVLMNILRQWAPVKMPAYWIKGNRALEFNQPTRESGMSLPIKRRISKATNFSLRQR